MFEQSHIDSLNQDLVFLSYYCYCNAPCQSSTHMTLCFKTAFVRVQGRVFSLTKLVQNLETSEPRNSGYEEM